MTPTTTIQPHPELQQTRNNINKLRTELTMLHLEHDQLLYQECKNIQTEYMLQIGNLEYKTYQTQCTILKLKRKIQLIQTKINRQELINLKQIDQQLNKEFQQYQNELNQKIKEINEALQRKQAKTLTPEQTKQLKQTYREIIKNLHPDLNPNLNHEMNQLFQQAINAYQQGDLQALLIIATLTTDPPLVEEKNIQQQLQEEQTRLQTLLQELQKRIQTIRTTYPYTMKTLLQDPIALEERKNQLQNQNEQDKQTLQTYQKKIQEMLR